MRGLRGKRLVKGGKPLLHLVVLGHVDAGKIHSHGPPAP